MKKILSICAVFALSASLFVGCKQEVLYSDNIELTSFTFEPSANPGLSQPVNAVIEGRDVYIRVPNAVDITAAIPSFKSNEEKMVAFVKNKVQESGVTVIDLSNPTVYQFNSPTAVSDYTVHALKNAAIISFGFYAADNPDYLFKDYKATIKKLDINIEVPVDADITSLVAQVKTTDGATIKVNGADFLSGKTILDYTNPQTLVLSDAASNTVENFVVTVGRLTAPVWSRITLPAFMQVAASAAAMDLNPVNNQPHVMIQRSGSTDDLKKAVMGGYDSETKQWVSLGAQDGFSATRVDVISMAFSKTGVPYAAFKDYAAGDGTQNASLMKFENNAWTYVGAQQGSFNRVNYLSLQLDNEDVPYLGYLFARAAAPYPSRGTYVESFKNGAWLGQTFSQSSTGYYAKLVKGRDNKLYYVTMDLTRGAAVRKPSVYQLNNGTWKLIGTTNVGPTNSNSGGFNIDLDADEDGNIYLIYQSNSPSYITYVMHWDGTSWKQLGDGFAQTSNSSANRDNVAVKVHPDGRVFVAYGDAVNGVKVTTFNNETGNWNPSSQLMTDNGDKFEMRISKEGIPYLVTVDASSRVALFKYDIPE